MYILRLFLLLLFLPFTGSSQVTASSIPVLQTGEGFVQTNDGVQLYYRLLGSGPDTVIIIHGGPGLSMDYFLEDLSPLARNYTLLFYDQRGAGKSTLVSDSAGLSADRFAEDLNAIRQHFGFNKLTLFCHSWGSAVVALYASKYPQQVAKIIAVGVLPLQRQHWVDAFRKLAASRDSSTLRKMQELRNKRFAHPGDKDVCNAYYKLWFEKFYADPSAAGLSKGDFCAGTTESHRNAIHNVGRFTMASLGDWDWRVSLGRVTAPALIIHGILDPLPAEGAKAWAAVLPEARLMLLDNVSHFPYIEVPDRFFGDIHTFLRDR